MPPERAEEQSEPHEADDRRRQADKPALERSRFCPQHVLHEPLASRHIVETLLIRRNAPYFLVGQWFALIARCPLLRIQPVDLEPHKIERASLTSLFTATNA